MKVDTVTSAAAGSNAMPVAPPPAAAGAPGLAPAPAAATPDAQPALTVEAARQAAAQINEFLKSSAASVEFTVDGNSNHIIVRVVDSETNKLIRQIPSEETLAIAHALDRMSGLLFQQKA